MNKHEMIREICTMMADIYSIDFFAHRNHPTIKRDYTTYEIWSIIPNDDGTITLSTIPIDPWVGKVVDLTLDGTWRMPTIEKVKRIVADEIKRMGRDE